jgi:hypothetical protein
MGYSQCLRQLFPDLTLQAEDMMLLESFQVKYLPDRVPHKAFAVCLQAHPLVHRYLELKYPPIADFISTILSEHQTIEDQAAIEDSCQELLWEIAEMIVYNKYPEMYDQQTGIITWKVDDILSVTSLKGKTVVDAGAGTGRLAFLMAPFAETVLAVEPVTSMRRFIRNKAARDHINNLYVMDGFLDSIPLPAGSVDVLMTSNAIGWNLEAELKEIERVLKPGTYAIHLMQSDTQTENPLHDILVCPPWNYTCEESALEKGLKLKYFKTI